MHADDFGGQHEIGTSDELRAILQAKYDGSYNEIWLGDPEGKSMAISVKDELCYLHYFPGGGHPGFHSVGDIVDPEDGMTIFRTGNALEEQEIMNDAIVPFANAVAAAEEFFADPTKLPQAVAWEEL